MKKLLVQDFIKSNTLGELYHTHGVEVSFSKDGTKASFNYSQLNSKDSDKLACQCRGLILARKDGKSIFEFPEYVVKGDKRDSSNVIFGDSVVVSYGFDRFFNEGQGAAYVDWQDKDIKVYEKLDGTCIFLYFYNGKWHTATRSSPEADVPLEQVFAEDTHTFSSLFKKCLFDTTNKTFDEYTSTLNKDNTYVFELTSPINRIVVKYNDYRVTLLAIKNKKTFEEYEIESSNNLVPCVFSYKMNTLEQILGFVNSASPLDHEGIVVRDSKFNRVKIKNIQYVTYNRARDLYSKSNRGFVQMILFKIEDDVIPYLPDEIVNKVYEFKDKLSSFINYIESNYKKYVDEVNSYPDSDRNKRKRFAELVQLNEEYQNPFFVMYSGKANSFEEYINKNKDKSGKFPDNFLDNLSEHVTKFNKDK